MFNSDSHFEDEVRRLARLLWPGAKGDGAAMYEGRERDGIFYTEEIIHVLECTTSRTMKKAKEDAEKIAKAIRSLGGKHPTKLVKGWFITLEEPTADQRKAVKDEKSRIEVMAFDEFRSKLVDGRGYLDSRNQYAFGSVRDPSTGKPKYNLNYIPLDITDNNGESVSIENIAETLIGGKNVLITGDYGAGKSSTAREIFLTLQQKFLNKETSLFPVMLNLRDHYGQVNPVEALERHSRLIGFPAESIVKAWRAGLAIVLLDGFDEIASAGWAGKAQTLKKLRFKSMELIRAFVKETPDETGLLITGRQHFFDNHREMIAALAIGVVDRNLQLSELSPAQVKALLASTGWGENVVPSWLPTRPLLLTYLSAEGFLDTILESPDSEPSTGWHGLLDKISERESEILHGSIDKFAVRRILERLATISRKTSDGLGPLTQGEIYEAFTRIAGYEPDDEAYVLLQRLPGLGASRNEDGSREFIDKDFAEAARAGNIYEFIIDPFHHSLTPENWQTSLQPLATEIAALRCKLENVRTGKFTAAYSSAQNNPKWGTLVADLVSVNLAMQAPFPNINITIRESLVSVLSIVDKEIALGNVTYQDCIISILEIEHDIDPGNIPVFINCHIALVMGRIGTSDLPPDKFSGCNIDEFEAEVQTTQGILALSLPPSTRIMLTILKKLYVQKGSGRQESALFRGLDQRARQIVPNVLELLKKEEFTEKSRPGADPIWLPSKSGKIRARARKILAAPMTSTDPLVKKCNMLGE